MYFIVIYIDLLCLLIILRIITCNNHQAHYMEISVINKLIDIFPNMEIELTNLKQKIVDVYDVFLNLTYYDYKFGNNFNLKAISSILLNKNFYNSINSGLQAMTLYENSRKMENLIEAELIKQDLINYCLADTKATIEIVNYLKTLKS
jgi:hypothetical protein